MNGQYRPRYSDRNRSVSEADRESLRASLIDQAFRQSRGGIPMTAIAVLSLGVIHWLGTRELIAPWWFAAMTGLLMLRAGFIVSHARDANRFGLRMRELVFTVPLVLTAALWTLVPVLTFPAADEVEKLAVICVLSGMAGGATTVLAPLAWPARFYIVCMLAPASVMIYPVSVSGPVLSMLGFSFLAVMLISHTQARTLLIVSQRRLLENQALLGDLRGQQSQLSRLNAALLETQNALLDNNARLEQEVEERTERIRLAFAAIENTAEGVAVFNPEGHFVEVNPAFTEITGYPAEEVIGQPSSILRSPHQDHAFYEDLWTQLRDTGRWEGELWSVRRDGSEFLQRRTMDAVRDADGTITHFVSVFNDITDDYRKDQQLLFQARHDALTGLANRSLLTERLESGIARAREAQHSLGLLFFDLDHFKAVNDAFGHLTGDRLLTAVSRRLLGCLGSDATLARVGGDEFVVLMEDIRDPADCAVLADRLLATFHEPFEFPEARIVLRSSLGIAVFPRDGDAVVELLRNADMALYAAKAAGRNTYAYFDARLAEQARQRLDLELALREAIQRRELSLHYQAKVGAHDGQILGFEALLRWHRTDGGTVPPDRFIPVAEESGLIGEIGGWVIAETCRQIAAWARQGKGWQRVAVNVSARQLLGEDLVELIRRETSLHGIDTSLLEIEVTESFIMSNPKQSLAILRDLRQMGLTIAIDDFGTGYSSLSYLRRLPADVLKIDRSFVQEATSDRSVRAIIETIVSLSRTLGMSIVAEGVETAAEADLLRNAGCDVLQGYLFAKPTTAEEVGRRLLTEAAVQERHG